MPIPQSTGYIVPPNPTPTTYQLRFMCVPDDGQWIATINAALYELTVPANWDITTIDGQEANVDAAVETARNVVLPFVFQSMDLCMDDFCQLVADCIENDANVAQALATVIASNQTIIDAIQSAVQQAGYPNGGGSNTTISPDANDNNILPLGYQCDNNHLYGMAMELVATVHEATEEIFQQIDSAGGNWLDLVNSILDNIPLFELIGLVTEVIDWYADTISTAYSSAWSTVVQQELACDLFCLVKDDCNLSYEDIFNVYLSRSGITAPPNDTFDAWWQVIQSAALGNDVQTVALVDLLGLVAMRFGSKFSKFAIGIRSFDDVIELAQDAVDPDWAILCDDCNEGCYLWDFTIDAQGWQIWSTGSRPFGVYVAGVGWQCTWDNVSGAGFDNRIYIENLNWAQSIVPSSVEVDIIPTAGGALRVGAFRTMVGTTNGTATTLSPTYTPDGTPQTVSGTITQVGDGVRLNITTDTPSADQDAVTVTAIRLFYETGQPEGGQECGS